MTTAIAPRTSRPRPRRLTAATVRRLAATIPPAPPSKFVSRREAAEILAISTSTLDRMVSAGELSPIRIAARTVRFLRADVEGLGRRAEAESATTT